MATRKIVVPFLGDRTGVSNDESPSSESRVHAISRVRPAQWRRQVSAPVA